MPDELELLGDLGREVAEPDDASVARARDLLEQRIERGAEPPGRRARGLRSGLLVAVVALALGGVLGFGIAGSLAPSGSATSLVGFGFLPSPGWNVVQSGTLDASGVARAVAANVPLDPEDDLRAEPVATIRTLPARGVVISATFTPRGNAEVDATYPVRQPPLLVEEAEPVAPGRFELRAGIRGHNVLLRFAYGAERPSSELRAAAQRQLDRLIVGAERVTIFGQPSVVSNPLNRQVRLFGSIDSNKAGETIEIQAKDCGSTAFRLVAGTTTESGGAWSTNYFPGINTRVRAVWDDVASPQIAIRVRVYVTLRTVPGTRRLRAAVSADRSFWRKRVEIQQLDRRLGSWRRLQTIRLTRTANPGGGSYTYQDFVPRVARGTALRAVMPLSQARPCYLAGTSTTLRW